MAFIEKKNPIVLNIKLTSKGRELLAAGELDFKYYGIGDSEVDYKFNAEVNAVDTEYSAFDSSILRAADKNPKLISFISRNLSGDSFNEMTNIPITAYSVENQVESLGFFTDNNTKFIVDSNHVKQPDAMVDMGVPGGGKVIELQKAPTYGTSGEEPAAGDILFVQWTYGINTINSTYALDKNYPTPNLFYRITEIIEGTLASATALNPLKIRVDREIPDFQGYPVVDARAMIYWNEINYSGDTVINMSSTDYLDESVLSFLENSQCPTIVFPYWNMSIVYTEEIAGVQAGNLKYTQFKNRKYGGFVSYIQNQAPVLKKLGVIHYSNSSPANVYGEGFLQDTPTLDIPTIMWHKSGSKTLGVTLGALGSQKLLEGLDIYYYDLTDPEGFIVGKIFPDLKIFVIEDQELLFAMSYKSNRSWTIPDFDIPAHNIKAPAAALVSTAQGSIYQGVKILTGGYDINRVDTLNKYGMQYRKTGDIDWIFAPTGLIDGSTLSGDAWSQGITGLASNTTYDFRAYVSFVNGVTSNGETFQARTNVPVTTTTTTTTAAPTTTTTTSTTTTTTTLAPTTTTTTAGPVLLPTLLTGVALATTEKISVKNNKLLTNGGLTILEYGVIYTQDPSATLEYGETNVLVDSILANIAVNSTYNITGTHIIASDTNTRYRAFARNANGIGYDDDIKTIKTRPTTYLIDVCYHWADTVYTTSDDGMNGSAQLVQGNFLEDSTAIGTLAHPEHDLERPFTGQPGETYCIDLGLLLSVRNGVSTGSVFHWTTDDWAHSQITSVIQGVDSSISQVCVCVASSQFQPHGGGGEIPT